MQFQNPENVSHSGDCMTNHNRATYKLGSLKTVPQRQCLAITTHFTMFSYAQSVTC